MRYRTKITFVTGGKEYRPGELLPADISSVDLNFLKSKGFVSPEEGTVEHNDFGAEDERRDFFGFNEQEPDQLKSLEEIRKIRSKKDAFSYAASIGLDFGEDYESKSLKELLEEIINFQEEQMDGEED